MTSNHNDTYLIPPNGDDPPLGLFSVVLGRGTLERGIAITNRKNGSTIVWLMYLDGEPISQPSEDWRLAFGRYSNWDMLLGRRIDNESYSRLITARRKDRLNGIDLSKPLDMNKTQVAI